MKITAEITDEEILELLKNKLGNKAKWSAKGVVSWNYYCCLNCNLITKAMFEPAFEELQGLPSCYKCKGKTKFAGKCDMDDEFVAKRNKFLANCEVISKDTIELCNQRELARNKILNSDLAKRILSLKVLDKEWQGKVEKLKELLKNHFLYKGLIIDFFDEIFGEKK